MTSSVVGDKVKKLVIKEGCDFEFIDKFTIAKLIPDDLKKQISNFHVFYDNSQGHNILFVTKSDQVYGLGSNTNGCLGFGHDDVIDAPLLVHELCGKKVQRFHIGMYQVFALCKSHIYVWRILNGFGKAERVESLSGIQFESMISGRLSTFGITYERELYQFKFDDVENPEITKRDGWGWMSPVQKAQQVGLRFFLIFHNGWVAAWGHNGSKNLGITNNEKEIITEPVFLELDVEDIQSTMKNTYFLKKNGHIYFCGVYYQCENGISKVYHQCEPKELDKNRKFQSIAFFDDYEYILAKSNDKVFKLVHDQLYETCYSNYKDYLADNFQLTLSTLKVNNPNDNSNGELQSSKTTISHKNNADRFEIEFSEKTLLGEGGFGVAYKVRDIFDGKYYCIKKIDRHKAATHTRSVNTTIYRERFTLMTSFRVNSRIFLKFYGSWEFQNFTYFKLELMDNNLSDFVKLSRKIFKRSKYDKMDAVECQLYCHVFIEILSCVHALHVKRMIHRDLKLENILINFVSSDNHIKLGDLGSARFGLQRNIVEGKNDQEKNIFQDDGNLTQGIGTPGYIAPEVKRGTEYSFSADIWSLGVIAKEIFVVRNFKLYENDFNLCKRIRTISTTIQSMSCDDPSQRPVIEAIANKFWSVINTDGDFKRKLLMDIGEISRSKDDSNFDDLHSVRRIRLQSIE